MKSVAIMQPTFLPWVGYFDLLDHADEFVFLDNVQFEKQSWQQRNRILGPCGLEWVTVPVLTKGRFGQKICDVEIKTADFPAKHLRTIAHHYAKAPYFDVYWDELQSILLSVKDSPSLVRLNMNLVRWLSKCFLLEASFRLASDMQPEGGRSERLVDIIKALGASQYISPRGAAAYLKEDRHLFSEAGIHITFQNYEPHPYRQRYPGFVVGACALDILFNEGSAAGEIIRCGRRNLCQFNEVSCEKIDPV
jgi:hypothetical protein